MPQVLPSHGRRWGGIDPKKSKKKLLKKALNPLQVENAKDSELVDMVFLPGFSTKEEVTEISGMR